MRPIVRFAFVRKLISRRIRSFIVRLVIRVFIRFAMPLGTLMRGRSFIVMFACKWAIRTSGKAARRLLLLNSSRKSWTPS
jgi:hypothetical protein